MDTSTINRFKIGLSWTLGVIFLLSTMLKVSEPRLFISFLDIAFSITQPWSHYLLIAVVAAETVLGVSLLFFYRRRWPFWTTGILMIFFCCVIGYALAVDLQASCGCFGSLFPQNGVSVMHLIRNISMAVIAFGLSLWPVEGAKDNRVLGSRPE